MKTLNLKAVTLFIFLCSIVLSSCEGWDLTGIKGNGPIVAEDVYVDDVEGIRLDIPATVYLMQGNEQSIRIEAQQNILDNIEKSDNDNVLKLKFDKNVFKCEAIKVYMTIKNLNEITISGSGEVVSESKFITSDDLIITISGSGDANIEADAHIVELYISGSGEIKFSGICDELYGNISGSGNINLENGLTSNAGFKTSGSGDINAFNFPVEVCTVKIAGSGDSRVKVSEKLNVSIAGSGNVYYKGNPQLSVSIAGSGELLNAN